MKIKHFAGHGTVNAKKISSKVENGHTILKIEVSGNHEQGLERPFNDEYCIKQWLLDKFDKSVKDKTYIDIQMHYICDDASIWDASGHYEDRVIYSIRYNKDGNMMGW